MTTEMCLMCQMCLMTTEMFEENMRNNVVNIVIKASALIGLYYNLNYISIISFINIYTVSFLKVKPNMSYHPETVKSGQNRLCFDLCDLEFWTYNLQKQ